MTTLKRPAIRIKGVLTTRDLQKTDFVVKKVCEYYGLPIDLVVSKARDPHLVRARAVISLAAREVLGMSLLSTGRLIGNRNHATVLLNVRVLKRKMSESDAVMREVNQILQQIVPSIQLAHLAPLAKKAVDLRRQKVKNL